MIAPRIETAVIAGVTGAVTVAADFNKTCYFLWPRDLFSDYAERKDIGSQSGCSVFVVKLLSQSFHLIISKIIDYSEF